MEKIENKCLDWNNVTFGDTKNEWMTDEFNSLIIKNGISRQECINKFVEIDESPIAEYNMENLYCKILKKNTMSNFDMFNKYADTTEKNRIMPYLKNSSYIENDDISVCKKICKKDEGCIMLSHDVKNNKCIFTNMMDKKNNIIFIKM